MRVPAPQWRQRRLFDLFAAVNLTVFLILTALVSWPHFVRFRGRVCAEEFLAYLLLALALMAVAWHQLRRSPPSPLLLALFQAAILGGVAGAAVPYQGGRLYEAALGGVTFDKPVHVLWAFAGGVFVCAVLSRHAAGPVWLHRAVVVLATMGLGAAWELVEYLVVTHVPAAGVGLYDNNMQDLLANAAGALASLAAPRSWCRLGGGEDDRGAGG